MKASREVLIGLLALLSIMLVAVETLVAVSQYWLATIYVLDLGICVVFAVDFAQRLRAEPSRASFFGRHGYEVLAMVPAIALQLAGALPGLSLGLRALRLIRVVRVILVVARMRRAGTTLSTFVRRSHLAAMAGVAAGIIFLGGFGALLLDVNVPGAQITNASDAIWWSLSTVTTVGYGDIVPASIAGRVLGMLLMVVGIGVMGAFISQVSATVVESRLAPPATTTDDLRSGVVAEMKRKLDNVEHLSDSDVELLVQMINTLRSKG